MLTREDIEKREEETFSEYACRASETRGRDIPEPKCDYRTDFQRDRDRIIYSKAFRRLMHKTQVFIAPEGDHFRTRLTHTLEVSHISRTVARALSLNEDLTEAIALGHDLGHTPFGHNGEKILDEIHPGGFRHNVQSLRVVEVLERYNGRPGMTLIWRENNLMLIFLLENKEMKSASEVIDKLEKILGTEDFERLFPLILTDNGSEFADPGLFEYNADGSRRTSIYYCEPKHSEQKGGLEKNHA